MEFETHVILIQNVFSVLPLYFTALISKASKAYDWGKSNKSSRFQSLFALTLLVSVLGL